MKADLSSYESKMKKSVTAYETELSTVRAGRANPAILDKVMVDYYGSPTPINQIGEVKIPDARTIIISPWDATTLKAVEKAINTSDLGINPVNDGKVIRLTFPPLTEERRRDLTKQVAKMGEDAKVALRNIRRDANDKFKASQKKTEMTEDELKQAEKGIQDITDKYIKDVDKLTQSKDKEILEI